MNQKFFSKQILSFIGAPIRYVCNIMSKFMKKR